MARLRVLLAGLVAVLGLIAAPAVAAIGTPYAVGSGTLIGSSGLVVTVTTTADVAAGDLVVVLAAVRQVGTMSISAGGPGCAEGSWQAGAAQGSTVQAFYCTATSSWASGSTIDVTFTGATGDKLVYIAAVSGAVTPFTNGGGSGSTATPTFTTGSLNAGQIVFSEALIYGGASDSYTPDPNFTVMGQAIVSTTIIRVAYRITSGSGPVTFTLTDTTSSHTWATTYLTASPSGGVSRGSRLLLMGVGGQ